MAVYRISRYKILDMDKAMELGESLRDQLSTTSGADFIDVIREGENNGVTIARYPDLETMEKATSLAQQTFGRMIEEGAVDPDSIEVWQGDVILSF